MLQKDKVDGLAYQPQFITKEDQRELVAYILDNQWNTSLKRRTQHYGFTYSYTQNNKLQNAEPIPAIFEVVKQSIEAYIRQHQYGEQYIFDQIIVNQYVPGQGISPHIDNTKLFDKIVVSLSLASDTLMQFQNSKGKKVQQLLQRRSLLILTGDSRNIWKHSIPSRKSDKGILRKTRYSLTFRKIQKKQEEK